MELTEVDENCDAEDEEETISNQKKSMFEKPVHTAGPSMDTKMHDFAEEGELERINRDIKREAEMKDQLYYKILHSKNKDFSNLLHSSESQSSELEFVPSKGQTFNPDKIIKQTQAVHRIKTCLQKKMKRNFQRWKARASVLSNEYRFKLLTQRLILQR
jgi:hypothetical protein